MYLWDRYRVQLYAGLVLLAIALIGVLWNGVLNRAELLRFARNNPTSQSAAPAYDRVSTGELGVLPTVTPEVMPEAEILTLLVKQAESMERASQIAVSSMSNEQVIDLAQRVIEQSAALQVGLKQRIVTLANGTATASAREYFPQNDSTVARELELAYLRNLKQVYADVLVELQRLEKISPDETTRTLVGQTLQAYSLDVDEIDVLLNIQ